MPSKFDGGSSRGDDDDGSAALRRLRWTYVLALALIASMALISHGVLDRVSTVQAADARVINAAGRQRSLSQTIAKLVVVWTESRVESKLTAADGEWSAAKLDVETIGLNGGPAALLARRERLRDAHELWIKLHAALREGDAGLGLPATTEPALLERFAELDRHVVEISGAVQRLLSEDDPHPAEAAAVVLAHEGLYFAKQDALVDAFEERATQRVARLKSVVGWLTVAKLTLLVAMGFLVFEPMRRRLRIQLDKLYAINASMMHSARHDTLTGLPNRPALLEDIAELCRGDAEFAVCFLDFDRFKAINDALGHDAGDQLLRNIAERTKSLAEAAPPLKLRGYRLGGDEFVITLDGPDGISHNAFVAAVSALTSQALGLFAEPHSLMNQDCVSTASIGVVYSSQHPDGTPETLLRDADLAMLAAKQAGKGRVVVFDRAMADRAARVEDIERELRKAIRNNELQLRYQAIFGTECLELKAVEAMLVWTHPTLGRVDNAELLAVAAESDLIHRLGAWVRGRVAQQSGAASGAGGWLQDARFADTPIHLNVSHAELLHPRFADHLKAYLAEYPALRDRLVLECPSSVVGRGGEVFRQAVLELNKCGVGFALDNLEREQVSLTQLATLPLVALKVGVPDSLVDTVAPDGSERFPEGASASVAQASQHAAVLRAITLFGKFRDLRVIGTAIEEPDQISVATDTGVSSLQGRLLREPVSLDELQQQPLPDTLNNAMSNILDQFNDQAA
ncbi:MAG: EAL domain-containing protein [Planctomycetota bacterium]